MKKASFLLKEKGETRYVIEALHPNFAGMLHIFSEEQLELGLRHL